MQSLAVFAEYAKIGGTRQSNGDTVEQSSEQQEKANAVLRWLALDKNRRWLFIFDNVDRDYQAEAGDQQAYDIESFWPAADHGSVLITTRLPHLGEHGSTTKVMSVDREQGRQILQNSVRRCLSTQGDQVPRASCL